MFLLIILITILIVVFQITFTENEEKKICLVYSKKVYYRKH